ncbi:MULTISPECIES: MFS transporter [Streptomycetaceae]|uniref:MFS transporter n=1 Tax=Streptomycetaceae TaxID=2062 RepID=UPI00093F9EF3|nr:MFS transporter [Streptomyces sp. CB02056]OKI11067.1 MFS transporter [Streptomyces sp. CB02056]
MPTPELRTPAQPVAPVPRLPWPALLAMSTAGFVTIMTEALPAGVLPAMSADLGVGQSAAGQSVTLYAVGSIAAAIPLTAVTGRLPRKRLLLVAVGGFAAANAVTAVSPDYPLTMAARFAAGLVAGLLWALLAGYARGIVAPEQRGRAMAVAMAGSTVALSVGVPAGTLLAGLVGWRVTFGLMSVIAVALTGWMLLALPPLPGRADQARVPVRRVLRTPGVATVLAVTATFVLAHNVLYTYVAALLAPLGLDGRTDTVLLVIGLSSLVSILGTGALIDRYLRPLTIAASVLLAAAALLLAAALLGSTGRPAYAAAALWGLGFGGAATLLQTAVADAAGLAGDIAQSLLVTCWNLGIAIGGLAGGLLLDHAGPTALPWSALVLLAAALTTTIGGRRHGFPGHGGTRSCEVDAHSS